MELILVKSTYHAYSDEYRDVYIDLSLHEDMVRVEAYFNGKIIYSNICDKDFFTMY